MYLTDYHIHSQYSFDGCESIEDICKEALAKGLQEIAITDHYDLFYDERYYHNPNFRSLFDEIKKAQDSYRGKLHISKGLELGQPQVVNQKELKFLDEFGLDFIIGSIHNLEDEYDIGEYNFMIKDIIKVYDRYLSKLYSMTEISDFDVCGHITYPFRYFYIQQGYYPDLSQFKSRIVELYKLLIQRGKGIELNVSGLHQKMNRPMPDSELLKLYRECKGEIITIGSDAHTKEYIGCSIDKGIEILKEAGFSFYTTFHERKPHFHKI